MGGVGEEEEDVFEVFSLGGWVDGDEIRYRKSSFDVKGKIMILVLYFEEF